MLRKYIALVISKFRRSKDVKAGYVLSYIFPVLIWADIFGSIQDTHEGFEAQGLEDCGSLLCLSSLSDSSETSGAQPTILGFMQD